MFAEFAKFGAEVFAYTGDVLPGGADVVEDIIALFPVADDGDSFRKPIDMLFWFCCKREIFNVNGKKIHFFKSWCESSGNVACTSTNTMQNTCQSPCFKASLT